MLVKCYSSGSITYYPFAEGFYGAYVEILGKEYPITYGFDSSSEQVVVQTVVINNAVVGFHVIAPFEMPTDNNANDAKVMMAIGKAAHAINEKCQKPDEGFLQSIIDSEHSL